MRHRLPQSYRIYIPSASTGPENVLPSTRLLGALLVLPFPLAATIHAQTTATERTAAGPVLSAIDSVQVALAPGKQADRLAALKSADRDRVIARAASIWNEQMQGLSDWIGRHPETGWHEQMATDTLMRLLRGRGFMVDSGVAGLATAFVAKWDSPAGSDGPMLGLIME